MQAQATTSAKFDMKVIASRAHAIAAAKKNDFKVLPYREALAYGFKMAWAIAKGTISDRDLDRVCSMMFCLRASELHGELASINKFKATTWLTKAQGICGLDLTKLAEIAGEEVYVMVNLDSKSVGRINIISKARNKAVPALKGLQFAGNQFSGPAQVVAAIQPAVVSCKSVVGRINSLKKEMGRV